MYTVAPVPRVVHIDLRILKYSSTLYAGASRNSPSQAGSMQDLEETHVGRQSPTADGNI